MELKFHTLDVFTDRKFAGNPLAVVLDADGLTTAQMQAIAREFNLSETIFAMRPADPANTARVRIFYPAGEMPFAGHPTVGCAILLAERNHKDGCSFETEIRLEEEAGLVPVMVTRIGGAARAMFTAPVVPFAVDLPLPAAADVARAMGLEASDIGFGRHRPGLNQGGPRCLHVPVSSRAALAGSRFIEPHFSALLAPLGTDMAYLYTRGGERPSTHYRARMFAPAGGIPEDPATGAATALFARQLLAAGELAEGTSTFAIEQGYEMGRPSDLHLEADVAGGGLTAVRVAGQAVRVMAGVLRI
jgi:trans-2,3-dihydro-3-hydroxyanthranilate isomerase